MELGIIHSNLLVAKASVLIFWIRKVLPKFCSNSADRFLFVMDKKTKDDMLNWRR